MQILQLSNCTQSVATPTQKQTTTAATPTSVATTAATFGLAGFWWFQFQTANNQRPHFHQANSKTV